MNDNLEILSIGTIGDIFIKKKKKILHSCRIQRFSGKYLCLYETQENCEVEYSINVFLQI